jgi:hypothetical protein
MRGSEPHPYLRVEARAIPFNPPPRPVSIGKWLALPPERLLALGTIIEATARERGR